ncbi:hypothetical protein QQS21_011142 [Conoideocrella luteorostrata]|uniref:Carboxylic ester hydrolase n=1 Tax=Conoideocrella luteorostrata TaxID=1105319 RepID=A0AAJ0CDV7_9HYPO|nr:hypothetical protein QQS21_011142 [Conoideocrella luteorostrata]
MIRAHFSGLVITLLVTLLSHVAAGAAAKKLKCLPSALSVPPPFGAKIQDITASSVYSYNISVAQNGGNPPFDTNFTGLDFCNVTVTYIHPGQKNIIHVQVWLPLKGWNGRFQGSGGGGWAAGLGALSLAPGVALGYATAETDGGHAEADLNPASWALDSPGNVDLNNLQNFASTAMGDLAIIGKAVTKSFYGSPAKYSYWNGCSTGGREGFMLAQRYPDAFDGILAFSPVINWPQVPTATYWSQHVMKSLNYYPLPCEMTAITAAAIKACDSLDGVEDGIISLPNLCGFDARSLVGKPFSCDDGTNQPLTLKFSSQAATIANAAWAGPHSQSGARLWYGIDREAQFMGVANTSCSGKTADTCVGAPFQLGAQWIKFFLAKDPEFSFAKMSDAKYAALFHSSVQQYQSIIGTNDPDLSQFRSKGGKMIAVHGFADEVVPIGGTVDYYQQVLSMDSTATDYFRFFQAPGVAHCASYVGPYPRDALNSLVKWVERGQAPDTLTAVDPKGEIVRDLCPHPRVQRYIGGDPKKPGSFRCSKR